MSTAATPNAISQAATARAVSGVSGHGHSVRAVDGATYSATPTASMIRPCTVNAPASQSGIGSRRGGSTPGRRCCSTISTTSASGTTM